MSAGVSFGSGCSGIEAATVALTGLGFEAAWLSEIEPYPCALLAHHYPTVPNLGDMRALLARIASGEVEAPDVFCGGTPCQAFSVAGLRNSLDDARGNLSLVFCEIANALDDARSVQGAPPVVILWENVPGVLSTKDNAFGCFLAGLAGETDALVPEDCPPAGESGRYWKWNKKSGTHACSWPNAGCVFGPQRAIAWRVLDAQFAGVAQRRRRVFVVASARNGFDPAEILFEFDGVRRDIAPRRETGQSTTYPTAPSLRASGPGVERIGDSRGQDPVVAVAYGGNRTGGPLDVAAALLCQPGFKCDFESETLLVTGTLTAGGTASHGARSGDSRDEYIVPVAYRTAGDGAVYTEGDITAPLTTGTDPSANILAFDTTQITSATNRSNPQPGDPCHPLAAGAHVPAIAYPQCVTGDITHTLKADGFDASEDGTGRGTPLVPQQMRVRRLTPTECERLQGFPDGYTNVPYRNKPAADGPRYKAIGNSWAVPVIAWIGSRIKAAL